MPNNNWTEEWPDEPGWYWFWGPLVGLHTVVARGCPSGMIYVTDGRFLYEYEGTEGVWRPVELPGLPDD